MKKVAIITGAGGYIGGESAARLAKEGVRIAVCDINAETVEKTVERIRSAGGEAKGYVFDVTDAKAVEAAVESVVADFGRLDISVHVAGGSARIAGPDAKYLTLVEQDIDVIDKVIRINLYGAIYLAKYAASQMIKQGEGGRIISFSSAVGLNGLKRSVEYGTSKGGVISMTKGLAKELGEYGITVNSVAPGVVARPGSDGDPNYTCNTNFLNKKCEAKHIASLVNYLASDEAEFITGQTYVCDGGRSLAMKGTD